MQNHYKTLGIDCTAGPSEIKAAYRRRAKDTHPDIATPGESDQFAAVNDAYHTLVNDAKREVYRQEYRNFAHEHGLVVCDHCFSMVRVPRFREGQTPRCGCCRQKLDVTAAERDSLFQAAFAKQLDDVLDAVGVEGAALAKDLVHGFANGVRRKLGIKRGA